MLPENLGFSIAQSCFFLILIETVFNQDMLDQNFVNKILDFPIKLQRGNPDRKKIIFQLIIYSKN